MALLTRASTCDTLAEMESAADHRLFDGLLLATGESDRFTGAVYLLGYVAEMLVKTAYFRVRGVPDADDVSTELRGIPARARTLGLTWQGNLHNLPSLAELLVNERGIMGQPMDATLAATFQACVANVAAHWSETLRYRNVRAREAEVADMFRSVDWLSANHTGLWS